MIFDRIKFNTYEKSIILGLIFSVLFSIVNFSAKCNIISEKVLRLHVIANSNSNEDQYLKLKVRDKIIEYFSKEKFQNLEEAKNFAIHNKENIRNLCQNEIGFKYKVIVNICKYDFNTRVYDKIALPAGVYDSIRIIIGNGEGKNWWCVLFPQMCIPAAEECKIDNNSYDEIFSEDDKDIVENETQYKVKFKIMEIFESIHEKISSSIQGFIEFFHIK